MGNPKLKWTSEEKEAIKQGVAKYGIGQWKIILNDPEFALRLANRSNVQIKDKWRNMRTTDWQGCREKSNAPIVNKITLGAVSTPKVQNAAAASSTLLVDAVDDSSKSSQDVETAPTYMTMIFEAISSIKGPIGSNSGAITGFIERKYKVPQNFRKLLSSKLRRLVLHGKLDKVQDCYKIKEAALGTKTPVLKQREVKPCRLQNSPSISPEETVENAATIAAHKISEAQNKSLVAADAVKESEMLSDMAEDADSTLLIFKEMLEQCLKGETLLLA